MLTQGGGGEGFLPLPLPPRPLVTDRKWKPNVELAPNCPRCDSSNTKFCYYNNYSLTQPRYFCKNCRRYWTKGGSLRNVPIGGGCRKYRRGRVRISSNSTYGGGSTLMMPLLDRSRLPSNASIGNFYSSEPSSMANHGEGTTRPDTIDLALLYAKFLNQDQSTESDSRLLGFHAEGRSNNLTSVVHELPSNFNPYINEQPPHLRSSVVSLEPNSDPHFQFLREESVGANQCSQFMSLDSNGCGLQPLSSEDVVVQDMFWSSPPPPPLPTPTFPWQAMNMQRFEPVDEDQPTFHSNPVNGNNWSSFDLPEL